MKHIINVVLLIIVGTVVMLVAVNAIEWLPIAAAEEAGPIDRLFGLELNIIAFLYVLVMGFILYSVFAFRRKPGDESDGEHVEGNATLEIIWTVIPLITVVVLAFLGVLALNETMAKEPDELEVNVRSRQWSWTFEYPELDITSDELYLPAGFQAHLSMTSEDVIHSFWVPEFRVKQDTVPGITTELRIKPTVVGQYKVRCAELCGTSHAYMLANVNVLEPADFDQWMLKKQGAAAAALEDPVVFGEQVAQNTGCIGCHSIDGAVKAGPTWQGLYGKTETFTDGSTIVVDDAYLIDSIVNPGDTIVEGFADIMPKNYGEILSQDEISAIIAYIQSLK